MDYLLKSIWKGMNSVLLLCLVAGCSLPVARPTDPKTIEEQIFISEAVERSLKDLETGISEGTRITLEVSGLTTDETVKDDITQRHVKNVVAGWLGKQGLIEVEDEEAATYRLQAIVEGIGTRKGIRFLGMPAVGGGFVPIALPELSLWKRVRNQGYIRFYLDIFDAATGRLVRTTPAYTGIVTHTNYTVFFFIRWQKTDLEAPLERL